MGRFLQSGVQMSARFDLEALCDIPCPEEAMGRDAASLGLLKSQGIVSPSSELLAPLDCRFLVKQRQTLLEYTQDETGVQVTG